MCCNVYKHMCIVSCATMYRQKYLCITYMRQLDFCCNRWNLCVQMLACICLLFVLEWIIRGDARGTRRGSIGDSHRFKGTRAQEHRFPLGFWGTRVRAVSPYIILKGEVCALGRKLTLSGSGAGRPVLSRTLRTSCF